MLLACAGFVAHAQNLILINGKILTVDAKDSVAQAVAVTNGKIVAVGSNEEARKAAAPGARVIDLRGRAATPGLIDTHCHFQSVQELYGVQLSDPAITRIDDIVQRVQAKVAKAKPGEWIQGSGWDEGKLAERRYVLAADLDKVAPNNPVWLMHTTGHYGVANTYALKLAKVTRETKDPPAGTIDRDANGNPTGVFKESAAFQMITRLIPPYTRAQMKNGLVEIISGFNREGMTAVKNPGMEEGDWSLYRELLREDKLHVRIFALWRGGFTLQSAREALKQASAQPKPPRSFDGKLLSGGVKFFMDGSGGARTAWMYDDWNKGSTGKDTGNKGYPLTDPEVYRAQAKMFHEAGFHISTHAIGDRAIDWVVDTYAQLLKDTPTKGLRHGVIHCNTPTDHAIATMARLQQEYDAGYPEAQSTFMWWIGDNYAGNLGPQRALRLMPFQTYLAKGIVWSGGSDFPVTPFPARYGLWASVERRTLKGVYGEQPFGMAESVDIHAALRSYTIWAAHQLFLEKSVGSIEPGKDADIAVWDRDPYTIPAADLRNLKCELTLVRGQVVYDSNGTR
jgi:predicted amidohydrolase YtcJ